MIRNYYRAISGKTRLKGSTLVGRRHTVGLLTGSVPVPLVTERLPALSSLKSLTQAVRRASLHPPPLIGCLEHR